MPIDAVQQQDQQRTSRNFVSLISGAFGIPDQTYATDDSNPVNYPRQYQTIDTRTGAVGVQGTSISNVQTSVVLGPVALVAVVVAAAWWLMRRKA